MNVEVEIAELEITLEKLYNEFLKMTEFMCHHWEFDKKQAISLMLMYFRDKSAELDENDLILTKEKGKKCCKTN